MKETRLLMGMPVTLEVLDPSATQEAFDTVYHYFEYVDETFSTYKPESEISRINDHRLTLEEASDDMQTIFRLAERTKEETDGFFDIFRDGRYDPSGLVKGWSILNAAILLKMMGFADFYVDAGGDIQTYGHNAEGESWRVGIRNPFVFEEIVKVLSISDQAVATSGTYIRGHHIYRPHHDSLPIDDIVSLTVVGPNIYDADRYATAAFAMGREGILFVEGLEDFEGYLIDGDGMATFTSGFERYVCNDAVH